MKILIPKDYLYKGAPEQILEFTRESLDRGVENARKVFGDDFMPGFTQKDEAEIAELERTVNPKPEP